MVKSKTKHDTKILCSNKLKTGIFEILDLEDFQFVPYKRRFIAATSKLVFSRRSERLPNYFRKVVEWAPQGSSPLPLSVSISPSLKRLKNNLTLICISYRNVNISEEPFVKRRILALMRL
jgi:hypothetical protein